MFEWRVACQAEQSGPIPGDERGQWFIEQNGSHKRV